MRTTLVELARKCWNRIMYFCGRRLWTVYIEGDLPKVLAKNIVYIVYEVGEPWHVSLVCPCGCRQLMHLNLLPDERPCWRAFDHHDGTVTLQPSISRNVGCKSHFWLRRGKIEWCPTDAVAFQ